MANVKKDPRGTFTSYADKVFDLLKLDADADTEEAYPLIERCYNGGLEHEEAARRINIHIQAKGKPPEVDVYMPNDNPDEKAPYYIELYKVGTDGVKEIQNESMSHPRLLIIHDDGTETTIIGMPFVMRAKPEQDQSTDDEIPEPIKKHIPEL